MSRIHVWCPSVRASAGGIESYSHSLINALRESVGGNRLMVLVHNDSEAEVRQALGKTIKSVAVGRLPRALRSVGFASLVIWRALRERPDVIVTTHLNFAPFAAFIRRIAGIPYWVALHGYEAWDIERSSQARAVVQADLLLPVSGFTRDRVITNYGVPSAKMQLLYDTFDPDRFRVGPKPEYLLARYGLKATDPVVLTVSRLSAAEGYKGHDRLIRALPAIRTRIPAVKYLVVGDGDDRPRLETIARDQNVADAVIFAGRVADPELADHYRVCDLFAMPSTGEGFGIVFLEALATGKPVLAGNCDGARDALNHGELGVLVDPFNGKELADAIIDGLSESSGMGPSDVTEHRRERVIELFGPHRFRQRVEQLLGDKLK